MFFSVYKAVSFPRLTIFIVLLRKKHKSDFYFSIPSLTRYHFSFLLRSDQLRIKAYLSSKHCNRLRPIKYLRRRNRPAIEHCVIIGLRVLRITAVIRNSRDELLTLVTRTIFTRLARARHQR